MENEEGFKVEGCETLLYVEDDDELRKLMTQFFRAKGIKVFETHNAEAAIDLFENHGNEIDAVISDIVMPQCSGVDLFQVLHSSNPSIPFIFVSGYSQKEILGDEILPPNTRFIEKPCSPIDILNELSQFSFYNESAIKSARSSIS